MSKQSLFKTLLPISVVAICGTGISFPLMLSSCSKEKPIILNSTEEVQAYLRKNSVNCPTNEFDVTGTDEDFSVSDDHQYFNFMVKNFNRKAILNGFIYLQAITWEYDFDFIEVGKDYFKIFNNNVETPDGIIQSGTGFLIRNFKSIIDYTYGDFQYVNGKEVSGGWCVVKSPNKNVIGCTGTSISFDTSDLYRVMNITYDNEIEGSADEYIVTSPFDFRNIAYNFVV